ncbi:MAG: hypothetical protein ACLVML_00775 [Candidatus Gastranaerophilaceae bacterium]
MFIRRLYYGTQTGETLYSYVMSGDIVILSADDVAAGLGLTDYGHMEWLEPDPAIEDSFARSYGRVNVDVTQEPHALVFDYSEPPDVPSALDVLDARVTDCEGAINTLIGGDTGAV